ncbi:GIY-YIG nuclease family protein [Arthrobacter sp. ISL-95]|uniref:GIY-YIG nuclease family protein n=1 Tax=Arthrobacter sp. ISL-95 TaxID=2819116 RepID=UPI001BE5A237|nr:GIY-YIG nuclease family protein [Arthrobacter sp. ISL-95]MBT2588551.1 GIY-YIG nuclease family protein [Arthrobacter sp. ISL-95]
MITDLSGELRLGHIFLASGLNPDDVVVLRHTLTPDGLTTQADANGPTLLSYTREQGHRNKLGKNPPRIWLNFLATTGRRARFLRAFENHGEVAEERTETLRYFDLRPSPALISLSQRLVIEWTADPVNWAKPGNSASSLPIIEVADPQTKPFPGYDALLVSSMELQAIMEDDRYSQWRTALSTVQGIYLIADVKSGQLYVGKADGAERFLGRWSAYARTGHGGNVALREIAAMDLSHPQHFQFSILQVFSPSAPSAQVDAGEAHYKKALLTRQFGYNRN